MSGFNTLLLGLAVMAVILFALLLSMIVRRTRGQGGFEAPDLKRSPVAHDTEPAMPPMPVAEAVAPPPPYSAWRLVSRNIANPDSAGGPLYRLRIEPEGGLPTWQAGTIAHVYCGPAEQVLEAPSTGMAPAGDYLVGSLPEDGAVNLVIRHREDSEESRSQWLCRDLEPGQQVAIALRENPGFAPPADEVPLILIGNATGLAGLQAHIKARPAGTRNWLIFGDRNSADDDVLAAEIADWVSTGHLERCDLVFPGDGQEQRRIVDQMSDVSEPLLDWALAGAAIYVCGSTPMGNDVHAALCRLLGGEVVEAMAEGGVYRRSLH